MSWIRICDIFTYKQSFTFWFYSVFSNPTNAVFFRMIHLFFPSNLSSMYYASMSAYFEICSVISLVVRGRSCFTIATNLKFLKRKPKAKNKVVSLQCFFFFTHLYKYVIALNFEFHFCCIVYYAFLDPVLKRKMFLCCALFNTARLFLD